MVLNEQIIKQAAKIKPFELCYVETEGKEIWVHICLVQLYNDGYIMLLDEAQLPIDFEGEITFLWALPDNENRIATMGSYKLGKSTRKSWWQWWRN